MKKIEQINTKGDIILDYDTKLSELEKLTIIKQYFTVHNTQNPFECSLGKNRFVLCIKQITYLGNPHGIFKKRIQIPNLWKDLLKNKNTFLCGLYNYKDNKVFVFFDTNKYKNNKINNSSAHVHTIDIQKVIEYGIFSKVDSRNNKITVVRDDKVIDYIKTILNNKITSLPKEIELFNNFSKTLDKKWIGVNCYEEMFKESYRNKGQPEWVGFYLEYKFENYLSKNKNYKSICSFVVNKNNKDLDFDLDFNQKFLGDLKAHSIKSGAIPGNDKESFDDAIKLYGKFWYVVFYHSTIKDKDHNYITTKYWNDLLNKEDKNSYSTKMKHSIILENFKILEINKDNYKYISNMKQGKNSDGNKRAIKIQIKSNMVDNFLIYNQDII